MTHQINLPNGFIISDDKTRLDLAMIHRFLSEDSYWARGRSRALIERSIAHTLTLGAYAADGTQVGFATILTDRAVFALLSNVFVLPPWRGHQLGEALVRTALEHPELTTITRWTLRTNDAHRLYAKFGFVPEPPSTAAMELYRVPAETPP